MPQLVIAAAGAAIGGTVISGGILTAAGAFTVGAQIGWIGGSMIGSMFAPAQKSQGPRLSDLSVSSSAYGTPIPFVQGSPRLAGQIVYASNKREIATTTRQGGKGGGKQKVTTYTYEVDLLILLTDNIIPGITRIWSNGKLIWNKSLTADAATIAASDATPAWTRLAIFTGVASQLPDPTYEAAVGTANAPAYRGRGSVFIQSLQIGSSGQIPNLTFEIGATLSAAVVSSQLAFGAGTTPQIIALDDTYALLVFSAGGSGGYMHLLDISGAAPVSIHSVNFLPPSTGIGTLTRIDSTTALLLIKLPADARPSMIVVGRSGLVSTYGARLIVPAATVGVVVSANGDVLADTSQLDAARYLTAYENGSFLSAFVTTVRGYTVTSIGAQYTSASIEPAIAARAIAIGPSAAVGIVTRQPFDNEICPLPITLSGDAVSFGTVGSPIHPLGAMVRLVPLSETSVFCAYDLFTGVPSVSHANGSDATGGGGSIARTLDYPYNWFAVDFGALGGYGVFIHRGTGELFVATVSRAGVAVGMPATISSSGAHSFDVSVAPGGNGVATYVRSGNIYVHGLGMS